MDTVLQPQGAVGVWMGARVRLVEVVTAWGSSWGPDGLQGFLTLQVIKEEPFVFYGGGQYRPPVSVDKCPWKFTQDFSFVVVY